MSELKTCEKCGNEYIENKEGNWRLCNMCLLKEIDENKKMTELKTLKDILSSPNEDDYTDHSRYYRDVTLKQEAIKWVKKSLETRPMMTKDFMEFFNITEEDLKNE